MTIGAAMSDNLEFKRQSKDRAKTQLYHGMVCLQ